MHWHVFILTQLSNPVISSGLIYAYHLGESILWKVGLSYTIQEKSGQSYTFCWKGVGGGIRHAHPDYAIYRKLPPPPSPPPPHTHEDELLWSLAVRHTSTHLNDFSETHGQIFSKLNVEPPVKRGLKICTNEHDSLNKMAAILMYGKNT